MIRIYRANCFVFFFMFVSSVQADAEIASMQWLQAFSKKDYKPLQITELKQVTENFQQELDAQAEPEIWQRYGILRKVERQFTYFQELPDRQVGRGLVVMRNQGETKPWLLQIPHAKSDMYTGKIGALLLAEGEFKAGMWNSIPRKKADMAHLTDTYWQAVTQAFALYYQDARIIQLHGFSQSKRKSEAGRQSDIIISAGHRFPPLWVQQVARCLKQALPDKVSLYPYDVKELGATTNEQGHLLQALGKDGFLHIETSKRMRKKLLQNLETRQILLNCIG